MSDPKNTTDTSEMTVDEANAMATEKALEAIEGASSFVLFAETGVDGKVEIYTKQLSLQTNIIAAEFLLSLSLKQFGKILSPQATVIHDNLLKSLQAIQAAKGVGSVRMDMSDTPRA